MLTLLTVLTVKVRMISPQKGCDVIDMSATLDKHIDIVPYLLLTHAITGCDTAAYSGLSKNKALKILRQNSMNSAIISRRVFGL